MGKGGDHRKTRLAMDSNFRGRCDRLVLAAMKRDVTISQDRAAEIARETRNMAAIDYQRGMLREFDRGMYQGELIMVKCHMHPEEWIIQGIENELEFYCRRARQDARSK